MNWKLVVTKPAQKQLERLPARDRQHVEAALFQMSTDPFTGDIGRIRGIVDGWRRRVGNYRLLFRLDYERELAVVTGIVRRTSTTY
jgi:mRNA interferase RelE/StbE